MPSSAGDGASAAKKPRVEEDGGTHKMTIRRMVRAIIPLAYSPGSLHNQPLPSSLVPLLYPVHSGRGFRMPNWLLRHEQRIAAQSEGSNRGWPQDRHILALLAFGGETPRREPDHRRVQHAHRTLRDRAAEGCHRGCCWCDCLGADGSAT